MIRLIINVDDFGLTSGVNRAIAECSRAGAITSATLMANSRCFDEAVKFGLNLPGLKIGCHIVLIDGEPLSDNPRSLLENSPNGVPRFRSDLKAFALAAIRKKLSQEDIQRETEAQIDKIRAAGILPTHVDTHKHLHMFPHVLRALLKAAKACGVRAVRNPFEPSGSLKKSIVAGSPSLWVRSAEVAVLRRFAGSFRKIVKEEGMATTDGTIGVTVTGALDQRLLSSMIQSLPGGTWELVCHPGYADADLRAAGTRLVESRQVELQTLTSEETKRALSDRGIELISYADLKEM